jgi:hypothetical protein
VLVPASICLKDECGIYIASSSSEGAFEFHRSEMKNFPIYKVSKLMGNVVFYLVKIAKGEIYDEFVQKGIFRKTTRIEKICT